MTTVDRRLDALIEYLLDEDAHYQDISMPTTWDEKLQLYRSLVNVRQPKPISKQFLAAQDAFLQDLIREKGITDSDDLAPIRDGLYLWRGDITTLKVDAVVNAANSAMLGCFVPCHGCIDNAIHTYAGIQLRLACRDLMQQQGHPESTGTAKITPGFNLPSRYVIHTVGPIIRGQVAAEDEKLLADCYRSCLELAALNQLQSIAFCCISTGVYCFPNECAAQIATETVSQFMLQSNQIKKVIFNVFTELDERIYQTLLR